MAYAAYWISTVSHFQFYIQFYSLKLGEKPQRKTEVLVNGACSFLACSVQDTIGYRVSNKLLSRKHIYIAQQLWELECSFLVSRRD